MPPLTIDSARLRRLPLPYILQCCECSCVDGPYHSCGVLGFDCRDPACFDPVVVAEFPDCTGDWIQIGDGVCDAETNVASCGYDGGDVSVSRAGIGPVKVSLWCDARFCCGVRGGAMATTAVGGIP